MIYAKAEQDLIVNSINVYFELLRAYQILQFQYSNEAWNKNLYLTQKRKYEAGVVSFADLKTSNAQYEQAVANRADAQKSLVNAKAMMARLIGKKIDTILYVSIDTEFKPPTPAKLEYWLNSSEKYNLDISQKEFEQQATEEGVGIKWGSFFPNAYVSGGMNMSFNTYKGAPQQIDALPVDYKIANITGTANWNILRGGSDLAELKQASYNNQAANYAVLQTQREVYAGIVSSFETVTLDSIKIEAYKNSVYAGLASVRAILDGYNAGTQTIVDLLNRQTTLVQSQMAFAGSIFDYIEHYAELKQLQGSITFTDVEAINSILGTKNIISEIAEE
jgi:outer membrane protein